MLLKSERMPVISRINIHKGWIAVWLVTESCDELAALCSCADRRTGAGYRNEGRRREWYAWRALLRSIEGDVDVSYDGCGAPYIEGRAGVFISVSHTGDYVAVMLSDHRCGLDVEMADRDFSRVKARYISSDEEKFLGMAYAEAILWCTKEAAYKWNNENAIELRDDIKVLSVGNDGSINVAVKGVGVEMQYSVDNGIVMVWTK